MFYGSDLNVKSLPLPRESHHEWALLHEESPKNNYLLTQPEFLQLFNHTSTFKRESDFPLTLQYVESVAWLENKKFLIPTPDKNALQAELAPVFYAQSDCHVPSDRDNFVQSFMNYMKVDSYGSCVHNKDLPPQYVLQFSSRSLISKVFKRINIKIKSGCFVDFAVRIMLFILPCY